MLIWQDLLAALALVLILEGLILFATPGTLRRALEMIQSVPEQQLRVGGIVSTVIGLIALYLIRS